MSAGPPWVLAFGPDEVCLTSQGGTLSADYFDLGRVPLGGDTCASVAIIYKSDGTFAMSAASCEGVEETIELRPVELMQLVAQFGVDPKLN